MFDTISHVLPELSGVSRSKSKTIEQFRVLQQSGMDSICYIPPFQMDNNNTWGEAVQKTVEKYSEDESFPAGLNLSAGHTLTLSPELLNDLMTGRALPLNETEFVLIDLSNTSLQVATTDFYNLAVAGYYPIILYPEKDERFQENPDLLYKLVKSGAYTLIDASSMIKSSKQQKKFIRALLNSQLVHMVGNYTKILLEEEHDRATVNEFVRKHSPKYGDYILTNLTNLLEGRAIQIEEPLRAEKKFLSSFFAKSKS
ncbi:protein-tyrosine phosphatase [Alkalihalobacillus xiaoxiensis]|uniref:protein-tyrosine-phosphatase n=1 Tax=Shouchella xiaoxiensis TaxID=766895 RepID=A0ABS2SZT5_9BACI|nr:CpsB/CapC family capsule biosynthesis tyrosine phosphatase [Shouchella xiaoxiensis]MBM7839979.1 protein-tyrosine phosphatase [Shouchella xiaoxiensis]